MKPALAYHLVETFTNVGDKVLDPFSGSGTIPLEARLAGRIGIGIDISLLAVALSNAKLRNASRDRVQGVLDDLERWISNRPASQKSISDAEGVRFNRSIRDYFHEKT